MNTYLKLVASALGIMVTAITDATNAHPRGFVLFNFTLTVNDVSDPQVFVGGDSIPPLGKNTFKISARKSDYLFKVKYKQEGKDKEAICLISGAPKLITATIDPTKDGQDACTTQEFGRG